MAISALPSAPLITDPPDVFDTKASAHVASLSTLVTEINAAMGVFNVTKWISGTTYAIGDVTWSPADFQAYRRKTAGAGTTDPSADTTNWQRAEVSATSLQNQNFTKFTTGGTSAAFTGAPTLAIASNAAGQRFMATLHTAPTGSPTLAVSGLTALNFKYRDAAGVKQFVTSAQAPSGYPCDVSNDGTDWLLLNPIQAKGTTTNDNAAAGNIGESISSIVAVGAAVSLTTNTIANVTSISLTAGDWDISGIVQFHPDVNTSVTNLVGSISATTATLDISNRFVHRTAALVTGGLDFAYGIPVTRISLASPTTIYLTTFSLFTVSTLTAYGQIYARRAR